MQTKNTIHNTTRAALAALLLALAMPLLAHEGDLGSTPEDGATVQGSPEAIGIEFEGAMRITQFDVTGPNGRVRMANRPGNEPAERYFVEPAEPLSAGSYQVRWRGLARDGHMMSDGFRFTVED
ncbi:copper resistance CopC family protein [Thioalkalivibrio sp. AKL8]|uniref:copper resistance CopC family protein n=1 Tax=Thioalkalivibrio sp. AKL8 TaxID=1158156 RepID=UPI00037A9305|nr:copper resistance CopC family protein [Thioalkalivibrio sp. AKL8]